MEPGGAEKLDASVGDVPGVQLGKSVEPPGTGGFALSADEPVGVRDVAEELVVTVDAAPGVDLVDDIPVDPPVTLLMRPDGADDRVRAALASVA